MELLFLWCLLSSCTKGSFATAAQASDRTTLPCKNITYFESGTSGVVPCEISNFLIVTWTLGTVETDEPFIYRDDSGEGGPGFESGEYDVLADGSLVIRKVGFNHSRRYIVKASLEYFLYQSTIEVKVFVSPRPYYPVINGKGDVGYQTLPVSGQTEQISCTVFSIAPRVSLEWVVLSHPPTVTLRSSTKTKNNENGTFQVSLISNVTLTEDRDRNITLECTISNSDAGMFPFPTPASIIELNFMGLSLPVPVIDGCFSSPYNCTLTVGREGIIICSVKNAANTDIQLKWDNPDSRKLILLHNEETQWNTIGDNITGITIKANYTVVSDDLLRYPVSCVASSSQTKDKTTSTALLSTEGKSSCDSRPDLYTSLPMIEGCYSHHVPCFLLVENRGSLMCSVTVSSDANVSLQWRIPRSYADLQLVSVGTRINGNLYDVYSVTTYEVDSSSPSIELQCLLKTGSETNRTASVTLNFRKDEPLTASPMIEGCYTQNVQCILLVDRQGSLVCSATVDNSANVDLEWRIPEDDDRFRIIEADSRYIARTRIMRDVYIKATYIVEESISSLTVVCFLSMSSGTNHTSAILQFKKELVQASNHTTAILILVSCLILLCLVYITISKRRDMIPKRCRSDKEDTAGGANDQPMLQAPRIQEHDTADIALMGICST